MQDDIEIRNTALLVIDIVNACSHSRCERKKEDITYKKIREMVPRLKKLIAKYKDSGGKVIYVGCTPWDEKHLPRNIIELYKDPRCRYFSHDKTGFSEKFFEVVPEQDDIVITKNTYDAFANPGLDRFLKRNKIRFLIITGIFGDGCVHATIQGGFSAGYNFIILKDLIETTDLEIRQELQGLLKEYTWPMMFGKTINSDELFNMLK